MFELFTLVTMVDYYLALRIEKTQYISTSSIYLYLHIAHQIRGPLEPLRTANNFDFLNKMDFKACKDEDAHGSLTNVM